MYNKFLGKILSQIYKKSGYFLVIMMMLAASAEMLAADNLNASNSVLQQITITGTIVDDQGEPLPGANVVVKGTSVAVISNIEGRFSITVTGEDAVLVFSFVGFESQEILVGNQRVINVTLSEDASQIEELIVVGYGTQRRETLTGAVVAIQSQELTITKNTNVQNMLTGKLPGLRNIQRTSEPGTFNNQLDIRGMGSPLLVVDGVPRGDFARMDPNEIESITILKDASAAIYGMEAANGVILITTKSGEQGTAKIEYSGYYGIQQPIDRLQPVDAWKRAMLLNEVNMRSRQSPTRPFDETYFERLEKGELPDTDWYSIVMRNTAPQQQHNISVSGGTSRIDYFVNLGLTDQGSFWTTNSTNYKRYNVRSNISAQITDRLKAGVRLGMMMDETNRQFESAVRIFGLLWRSLPTDPVYANNTYPYYFQPAMEENVLALITPEVSGFLMNKRTVFQSNFQLDYDIPIKGLTTAFLFSFDRSIDDNTNYRQRFSEYLYDAVTDTYAERLRYNPTELTRSYGNGQSYLWNIRLNYRNSFAEVHNVGALFLYEERYTHSYNINGFRQFEMPIPYLFAGNSDTARAGGPGPTERAMKAVVGRVNYDYASKYIAEFSFRYDGSSRFMTGSQWGFFPSAQLAYRISEESFIKDNLFILDNLKIRATWGKLGDQGSADFQHVEGYDYPIPSTGRYNRERTPTGYIFGNSFVNGLGFRNAPNLYLTWITATMRNIGVDVDLLRGMLGFSMDIFQRDRDGLMATPASTIPNTFGSGVSQANLNGDRNKGFEIEVRHRYRYDSFRYNVAGNVALTRAMRTKIHQAERQNSYDYWRNNELDRYNDLWWGRAADGVYESWDDIINCPFADANTLPGDPKYIDWNGDGRINGEDHYPIATSVGTNNNYPLLNFGLTLNGQWKTLDFNLLFQGAAMAYVRYGEQVRTPLLWTGNALDIHLDRWHPANPEADPWDPRTEWVNGFFPYGQTRADENSQHSIQKARYLRLKSAEIGFTVPENPVFDRLKIKNMRLYVNAYNLFTLSGIIGLDPERPADSNGQLYPINRTFNFGGSITF